MVANNSYSTSTPLIHKLMGNIPSNVACFEQTQYFDSISRAVDKEQ